MVFYQGKPIIYFTHVTGIASQYRAESEYNAACAAGMYLTHFMMLPNYFLYKDTYVFP